MFNHVQYVVMGVGGGMDRQVVMAPMRGSKVAYVFLLS